ncbi:hypothetical protein [Acinetobacter nosocomialis]|nr:hypothetical protein [Acinetobacter nosocomialis]
MYFSKVRNHEYIFNLSNVRNGEVAEFSHLTHTTLYNLLNIQSVDYGPQLAQR